MMIFNFYRVLNKNAAKCDVLGLRMLKQVLFTVFSINWLTWHNARAENAGFRSPPPQVN